MSKWDGVKQIGDGNITPPPLPPRAELRPVKQLDLDAIERRHHVDYPNWSPVEPVCRFDGDPWPCETALLVAAARRAVPDGWEVAWTEDGPPDGWHFTPFLIPADDGEP